MKNLLVQVASVATITFLLSGCLKKTDEVPVGCDPAVTGFPFQIKDGVTNVDLFFGATAKYKPSELKLFPKNHTGEKDSIRSSGLSTLPDKGLSFIQPIRQEIRSSFALPVWHLIR